MHLNVEQCGWNVAKRGLVYSIYLHNVNYLHLYVNYLYSYLIDTSVWAQNQTLEFCSPFSGLLSYTLTVTCHNVTGCGYNLDKHGRRHLDLSRCPLLHKSLQPMTVRVVIQPESSGWEEGGLDLLILDHQIWVFNLINQSRFLKGTGTA